MDLCKLFLVCGIVAIVSMYGSFLISLLTILYIVKVVDLQHF